MARLGVVIPTLNEGERLPGLLRDLEQLGCERQIVVSDGGSRDETLAVARAGGARVVLGAAGRGAQLNRGAEALDTPWLCFLHADVRVPRGAREDLVGVLADENADSAVWRLAIDAAGAWFRVIEFGARVRDRMGGLPYGDQGLLVRRALFERVGGFPEIPIMEDVALIRAVRRAGRLRRLPHALVVSPRRWQREGPFKAWCRNAVLLTGYLAGVSPHRLARWYRPEPHPP